MLSATFTNMEMEKGQSNNSNKFMLHIDPLSDYLTHKLFINKLVLPLSGSALQQLGANLTILKKGTPLFSCHDETQPEIANNRIKSFEINKFSSGNIIRSDEGDFISAANGIFVVHNQTPQIIPVDLDGYINLKVADDRMSVSIDIYPARPGGNNLTVKDIIERLIDEHIVAAIDEEIILSSLEYVNSNSEPKLNIEVAKGREPVTGKDEYVEFLIEVKTDNKPVTNEDGTIDFHNINSVIKVVQNQQIAVIHPPEKGNEGVDIFGRAIKAPDGKKKAFTFGSNTIKHPENKNIICAGVDGFLLHNENSVEIQDTYIVRGDIDFSTGNIDSNGSLKVVGDVHYGFRLNLSKNIDILGSVTDAKLEAGEDINIKGGFSGTNAGILKAGGDINIKYIQNQTVYSRGSLSFSREIIDSKIYVKNKITGQGLHASIIGGYLIAKDFIEAAYIGNAYGAITRIEVGYDYDIKNMIQTKLTALQGYSKEAEKHNSVILKFSSMKRMAQSQLEEFKIVCEKFKMLSALIESLKEEIRELNKEIATPSKSYIKLYKTVYPGVKIIINGRHFDVTSPINSKTFMLSEEKEVIAC
jgi:hypothetical protein